MSNTLIHKKPPFIFILTKNNKKVNINFRKMKNSLKREKIIKIIVDKCRKKNYNSLRISLNDKKKGSGINGKTRRIQRSL